MFVFKIEDRKTHFPSRYLYAGGPVFFFWEQDKQWKLISRNIFQLWKWNKKTQQLHSVLCFLILLNSNRHCMEDGCKRRMLPHIKVCSLLFCLFEKKAGDNYWPVGKKKKSTEWAKTNSWANYNEQATFLAWSWNDALVDLTSSG